MRSARDGQVERVPERGRRRGWSLAAGVLLLALGAALPAEQNGTAHAQQPSSEDVEAAYLYNFGKFVRWPESASRGPMVICVAGEDSLSEAVKRLTAGEQISGRSLVVRIVSSPGRIAGCSIVYLGAGEREDLEGYLRASEGKPVLTVSDAPDFLDRGGVLQFVKAGDHVRFAANLKAASRDGLWLSSELLKVAVRVKGRAGNGGGR